MVPENGLVNGKRLRNSGMMSQIAKNISKYIIKRMTLWHSGWFLKILCTSLKGTIKLITFLIRILAAASESELSLWERNTATFLLPLKTLLSISRWDNNCRIFNWFAGVGFLIVLFFWMLHQKINCQFQNCCEKLEHWKWIL